MLIPSPSILFIDAYDSFSNNIIALLETELNATVRVLRIDTVIQDDEFYDELRRHDAVVCGPGPGTPHKSEDVGLMNRIWKLDDKEMIPVLGICLGFQSMALAFGAKVRKLTDPQHGMIRTIEHAEEHLCGNTIFNGVGEIRATLYQSLCVDISQEEPIAETACTFQWQPSPTCPQIRPLAWVPANPSTRNGPILQGIQHVTKPFWGLQYHPESICTNEESRKVIRKWFRAIQGWNKQHRRRCLKSEPHSQVGAATLRPSLLSIKDQISEIEEIVFSNGLSLESVGLHSAYSCHIMDRVALTVPDVIEALKLSTGSFMILESTNAQCSPGSLGRYSIIALGVDAALRFEYIVGNDFLSAKIQQNCNGKNVNLQTDINIDPISGVWAYLADFMEKRYITDIEKKHGNMNDHPDLESPFWGGLMGYTTYEMGLQGIGLKADSVPSCTDRARADLCFAWIQDSIVVDHEKNLIYIQHLYPQDSKKSDRFFDIINTLESHEKRQVFQNRYTRDFEPLYSCDETHKLSPNFQATKISLPNSAEYEAKVELCQEHIRNGDSYELCLTDQTSVTLPRYGLRKKEDSAWDLYLKLRARQPAPFAAFMRLGCATLVSSSPERFLKWDSNGKCQLRPMKGTVKKTADINTLAQAEKLLKVEKEQAENLMIVDLVRHDLHSIVGPGNVQVPKLMVVEEYRSVFQMISVVEGQIPGPAPLQTRHELLGKEEVMEAKKRRHTGIDVLAASLPPGSMTGAPKKRSCEILQDIEGHLPRSLYSGVIGYMDVGGRGDFSVIIRSMFRWDDEVVVEEGEEQEVWHIGAGGAVTSLSTPLGEREEMCAKLAGTRGLFDLVK